MNTKLVQLLTVVLFGALFGVGAVQAQNTYDVLFDLDQNAASGCSVTPSGGSAVSGYERRLRATVDNVSLQVTGVELQNCDGSAFQPVSSSGGPYPVGLNVGVNGGDVIELAVTRNALNANNAALLQLAFVANADAGSDVLATRDGTVTGGPIVFGLPFQVPTLSVWALIVLALMLVLLAFAVQRRMGRLGAVSVVLLVSAAVWAANFAADGDVSDWSGVQPNAQDASGDSTNGSSGLDILAAFAALENEVLFFRIDVVDLENQAPVALDDAYSTDEDTALNEAAPGVLANDSDADLDPITAVLETGPSDAQSFTLNADGSFDYTPNADFNGTDSFTYVANDGNADSAPATVTITINPINDPPVAADDTATTLEDDPVDIDVLANDSDVDGNLDPASVNVTAGPSNGGTSVNPANGVITYTKSGDFNGMDSFTYEVCDDGTPTPVECVTATVDVTVTSINDVPSFTAGGDVTVNEDAGAVNQPWAGGISAGPADEAGQVLSFNVTANSNAALFAAGPTIDPVSGNLSFTPVDDASGSASITVELMDDGGTADGGVDTSAPASFTITVNSVNDAPSFTPGPDQSVLENAGPQTVVGWATAISAGPADEAGQVLSFNITSNDNPALFSAAPVIAANGTLSYTPVGSGTANLTVELMDDGGTANGGVDTSAPVSFAIEVLIVNDAPSFTGGGDVTSDEDAGAQNVAGWASAIDDGDGGTQILTFNITGNTNTALFSDGPNISQSGDLSYTAAANASGSATITVELMDDGGTANGGVDTSPAQNFTITINPINDPPTVTGTPAAQSALGNVNITVPAVQGLIGPLTVTDPDGAGGEPFSVSGGPGAGVTSFTSANGGDVTITNATTGTYTYNPAPGFAGADSFDYVVCDSGVPAPAACSAVVTVNLTVSGMIWFVDAGAPAGGDGRLASPFNQLTGPGSFDAVAADQTADAIFMESGSYQGGLTLLNNQRLIGAGAGASLAAITGLTVPANSASLPATGGARPTVTSATNGVNLGSGNTLRGFNIGNAVDGIAGTNFGTLNASELLINGNGRALALDTGTASNVTIDSISSTNSAGEGLLLDNVSGSFTVTGLTTIDNAAGIGINIQNSPAAYTFGNVTVNNRGSSGVFINGNSGGVQNGQFGTVTINNQNASGTSAFGIDNVVTGGSTITVASVAINNGGANSSAIAMSNNDGATININGGSVQNAAGAAVSISNSTGNATYAGTIANTTGRSVQILNNGGGGVTTLSGNITDSGSGLFVNNNDQGGIATVSFTGALSLNTAANTAFTATNGGIVNATNAASTVTSSTAVGVNIANTTIGISGVTFRSVSVNGAANGIVLNNTGSGSFTVAGDGSTAGSGGTIQNTTGNAVQLSNASNMALNFVNISNSGANGIFGSNVTNFTLNGANVTGNGNAVNEGGLRFDPNLLGTSTISNSTISGSTEHNIEIINTSGTLNSLTISNSTIANNSPAFGADGLLLETRGSASATVLVNGSLFDDNRSDGIQISAIDNSVASLTVNGTDFTSSPDPSPAGSVGARAITLSAASGADLDFDIGSIASNMFENFSPNIGEEAINVTLLSTSTAASLTTGSINNNMFMNAGGAVGIDVRGDGELVMEINGNTANTSRQAIDAIIGDLAGDAATANLTITNNALTVAGTAANPNNEAITLLGDRNTVSCLNIRGNNGVASGTREDIIVDDFTDPAGSVRLESGAGDCGGACATSEAHLLANNTITDADSSATLVAPGTCSTVP